MGMGAGVCPSSISGMEVGEVMKGKGATYGFTLKISLHCFSLCVIGCVTWPTTILQLGSEMRFQTWFGLLFIQLNMLCFFGPERKG